MSEDSKQQSERLRFVEKLRSWFVVIHNFWKEHTPMAKDNDVLYSASRLVRNESSDEQLASKPQLLHAAIDEEFEYWNEVLEETSFAQNDWFEESIEKIDKKNRRLRTQFHRLWPTKGCENTTF